MTITNDEAQKLWELIEPIKVGMLTSMDGYIHRARPMHNVQDEFNGVLYYFTRREGDKVEEIATNPEVCISYEDHDKEHYVSLSGTAALCTDAALIDKFWNPFVGAWFPDGKDSNQVALLQIRIHQAEYWDSTSSRMVQLFKIAKANIKHEMPDMGENEKFG